MTKRSYFCSLRAKRIASLPFQQVVDGAETAFERSDVESVAERGFVGEAHEDLTEQRDGLLDVGLGAQLAAPDAPADGFAPEVVLRVHQRLQLPLAVGVVAEYLLEEVEVARIDRAAGHGILVEAPQRHEQLHRACDAAQVFFEKVGKGAVRGFELVLGVLRREEVFVRNGDEEVQLGGVIVEDARFGQPDRTGYQLQADSLVIERHEQPKRVLQDLFPVRFHGVGGLIRDKNTRLFRKKCRIGEDSGRSGAMLQRIAAISPPAPVRTASGVRIFSAG